MQAVSSLRGRVQAVRASIPTLRPEAARLGLGAFVVFPGRYGYDVVRRALSHGVAGHTGLWPPFEQPVVTRYGYGATGNYSRWTFSAGGEASQSSHSVEAVVWAAATPQAKQTELLGRGNTGGVRLGKTSGGVFYAQVYDTTWRVATGATAIVSGGFYVVHAVLHANTLRLYVNGKEDASVAVPVTPGFFYDEFWTPRGTDADANLRLLSFATANSTAWSEGVVRQRARDPWGILEWPEEAIFVALGRSATIVSVSFTATPGAGTLTISGQAGTVAAGAALQGGAGALAIQGQAANVVAGANLAAGVGNLTMQGQGASVSAGAVLVTGTGSLALQGQAAGVSIGTVLAAGVGFLTLQGQQASILIGTSTTIFPIGIDSTLTVGLPSIEVFLPVVQTEVALIGEDGTLITTLLGYTGLNPKGHPHKDNLGVVLYESRFPDTTSEPRTNRIVRL